MILTKVFVERVVLSFCCVFFFAAAHAEVEPNDSIPIANPLGANDLDGGSLPAGDEDWYRIQTPANGDLTITVNMGNLTGGIILTNAAGLFLGSASFTSTMTIAFPCLKPNEVFLKINSNDPTTYTVQTSLSLPSQSSDPEPNDTDAEAVPIVLNTTYGGQLGYADYETGTILTDLEDWYEVVTLSRGSLTATVDFGGGTNGFVSILPQNNSGNTSPLGNGIVSAIATCQNPDTFLIRVVRNGSCGGYTLVTHLDSLLVPDDQEPNSTTGNAAPVTSDPFKYGHLGYIVNGFTDNTDYHLIVIPQTGNALVTAVLDSNLSARLDIYGKNGSFLGNSSFGSGIVSKNIDCRTADTILVRLLRLSGCGGYTLTVETEQPTFIEDAEPNGSVAEANPIAFGQINYGQLGYVDVDLPFDNSDIYSFPIATVPVSVSLEVTLDSSLFAIVSILDNASNILASSPNGTGLRSAAATITTPGTYYARIQRSSGCGSYWFSNGPQAPCDAVPHTLNASNISATTAVLSWSPVPGAIRYVVRGGLQGIGSSNYLVIERPVGSPTSLIATILQPDKTYEWQVKAVCSQTNALETGWSALHTFSTLSCSPITADSTTLITATTARLNWTPSPVAKGYEIVGAPVGSSSVATVFVPGASTSQFSVAGLTPGVTYSWAVRVVCSVSSQPKITSALSNILTFTTLDPNPKASETRIANGSEEWSLTPNPAEDEVTVFTGLPILHSRPELTVYDLNGRAVVRHLLEGRRTSLRLEGLSPGVYFVRLVNADGSSGTKRLLKR